MIMVLIILAPFVFSQVSVERAGAMPSKFGLFCDYEILRVAACRVRGLGSWSDSLRDKQA